MSYFLTSAGVPRDCNWLFKQPVTASIYSSQHLSDHSKGFYRTC